MEEAEAAGAAEAERQPGRWRSRRQPAGGHAHAVFQRPAQAVYTQRPAAAAPAYRAASPQNAADHGYGARGQGGGHRPAVGSCQARLPGTTA